MNGWMILGIVLVVLFLLLQIRAGGTAEYSVDGPKVWLRLGWFRLQVYPFKKRKEKAAPKGKREKTPDEEPGGKPGGSLAALRQILPLVGEAAGEMKRRIRVDKLYLDFTAAAPDPAMAAMAFGGANALIGMIWPVLEQNFDVRDRRIRTAVDFQAKAPTVYGYAAFSARIGQMGSFALRYAMRFLKIYRQAKKPATTQKEAI